MIPASLRKYWGGEDAYIGFHELSYPENWRGFFSALEVYNMTSTSEIMPRNCYFYHCLPVLIGITQTHKGSVSFAALQELQAGARNHGISIRCKLMV